jgi:hypothetical protein
MIKIIKLICLLLNIFIENNMKPAQPFMLRTSENYLAISRSSSASKKDYWGRLFFRAESSLI